MHPFPIGFSNSVSWKWAPPLAPMVSCIGTFIEHLVQEPESSPRAQLLAMGVTAVDSPRVILTLPPRLSHCVFQVCLLQQRALP